MPRRYAAILTMVLIFAAPLALRASQHDAAEAFKTAMETMHHAMSVDLTGDADVDFVHSMIPHHQGAIDMAKIELRYGKDPELRELAERIVADQEREIAEMQAWLQARGN